MEQFVGFLVITAGAVLVLALLIAFNSARISVEERRRENATMMAFGVRARRVLGVVMREAVAIGLLATLIGTIAGLGVLQWILDSLASRTLPDFQISRVVSTTTLGVAVVVGVLSVMLAPLFLIRRIQRMNLPDTLRVME
jgi:putative ABC transport system permease protein